MECKLAEVVASAVESGSRETVRYYDRITTLDMPWFCDCRPLLCLYKLG